MKRLLIQRVAFLLISTLFALALVGMGGKPSSGSMVFPDDAGQAYASLADAMQSDGFSAHCLPTWIPKIMPSPFSSGFLPTPAFCILPLTKATAVPSIW